MANAFSPSEQMNEWIQPTDLNLERTVLATKDAKYEANIVQVESQIEAISTAPLLRDKDKQMLSDNIKNVTSQINQMSKLQLSRGTASLEMGKTIKGAVTPYLADQMAIAMGKRESDKQITLKREKHPELWNDMNYTDALEQAGYNEYMNGQTDSMGKINYVDNFDMSKLDESVAKWAKEFGRQTNFNTQTQDGITTITKFEDLSEDSVRNFIEHQITANPHLAQQLQINSRQNFKGFSDDEFKNQYLGAIKQNVEVNNKFIKTKEAELANYSEGTEEHVFITQQIDSYNKRNADFEKEVSGDIPFNRSNAQFKTYLSSFVGGYADTYAGRKIIDIDQNNYAFENAYKSETLALKRQEVDLKRQELSGLSGEGSGVGLAFDIPNNTTEELRSAYAQAESSYNNSKVSAQGELMSLPGYAGANPTEREAIYQQALKNVGSYNANNPPYSLQTYKALQNAKAQQQKLNDYTISVANTWKPKIEELFNGIVGGQNKDLNLKNLSRTLPFTSSLITQGKTDFTKLNKNQKNAVYAEIAENLRDNVSGDDKDVLDQLNIVAKGYRGILPKDYLPKPQEQAGVLSSAFEFGKSLLSVGSNRAVKLMASPFIALTQGKGAETSFRADMDKSYEQTFNEGINAFNKTTLAQARMYTGDNNLSELQERDINLNNQGVHGWFKKTTDEIKQSSLTAKLEGLTSITHKQGISIAGVDKADKPYTDAMRNLAATKNIKVTKDSQFSYYEEGNNIIFTVDQEVMIPTAKGDGTKKSEQTTSFSIPKNKVPQALTGRLRESDISGSIPNTEFRYQVPTNAISANSTAFGLARGAGITNNSTMNEISNSVKTFDQIVAPYKSKIKTQQQKDLIYNLSGQKYSTKVVQAPGGYISVLLVNGQPTDVVSEIAPKYSPESLILDAPLLTEQYIQNQLDLIDG